jgi:hypothetical protein
MATDDWRAAGQSNTEHLASVVKDLEHHLSRRKYREFWANVKSISSLFKELKPTLQDEREGFVATIR